MLKSLATLAALVVLCGLAASIPPPQPGGMGAYDVKTTGDSSIDKNKLDISYSGTGHGLPVFKKPTEVTIDGDTIPSNGWSHLYDENTHKLTIIFNVPYVPGNGANVHIKGLAEDNGSHGCDNHQNGDNDLSTSWHS